jgi:hypothetical protein
VSYEQYSVRLRLVNSLSQAGSDHHRHEKQIVSGLVVSLALATSGAAFTICKSMPSMLRCSSSRLRAAYLCIMAVSDHDIQRSAYTWISRHGERATAKAREMVEERRRNGDHDGADTWLRIIVAITELGGPSTDVRH